MWPGVTLCDLEKVAVLPWPRFHYLKSLFTLISALPPKGPSRLLSAWPSQDRTGLLSCFCPQIPADQGCGEPFPAQHRPPPGPAQWARPSKGPGANSVA